MQISGVPFEEFFQKKIKYYRKAKLFFSVNLSDRK